jgi:hypothetical protein
VRDYLFKLVVAFVITGVGGIALKKLGMRLPDEAAPVAWATFIGGFVILGVEYGVRNKKLKDVLTWHVVIAFGVAQLIAAVLREHPGAERRFTGPWRWLKPEDGGRNFHSSWDTDTGSGRRAGFCRVLKEAAWSNPGGLGCGIVVFGPDGVCGGQVAAEVCAVAYFIGFGWYRDFHRRVIFGMWLGGMIK